MREQRIVKEAEESIRRRSKASAEVAAALDAGPVVRHVENLTKPKSPGGTMKKAGIALIAAPDPVTGVAGVALVASAVALRKREPASLKNLAQETRKIMREMQSLRI